MNPASFSFPRHVTLAYLFSLVRLLPPPPFWKERFNAEETACVPTASHPLYRFLINSPTLRIMPCGEGEGPMFPCWTTPTTLWSGVPAERMKHSSCSAFSHTPKPVKDLHTDNVHFVLSKAIGCSLVHSPLWLVNTSAGRVPARRQ